MLPEKKAKNNFSEIEKYRLPIYVRGKERYVYFYVLDPESVMEGNPRLKRIRKKFNHIHKKKMRDEAALRFRDEVSIKLRQGWNPLMQTNGKKGFTTFDDAVARYEFYLKKQTKENVLRPQTAYAYACRVGKLKAYNDALAEKAVYIYQLDRFYLEGFLEFIYVEKDTSPCTRNNYLCWLSSLCSYFCSVGYISENPSEKITKLREDEKRRKPLEKRDLQRLQVYLAEHDPDFLLACMVHYYTLVRPNEMSYIRIEDISVHEQTLFVSKEVSKNRHDAKVTIPAKLMRMLIERGVFSYPGSFYLFGENFRPSEIRRDAHQFRTRWNLVRAALNFPSSYQFYSLKDTGISDTIDRVGLTVAKDQARHSSVATTNKYVRKDQMHAHPELKNFDGDL